MDVTTPVCAYLNMKGGVGKTTLAANVSREIFRSKKASVLLIDLDPQFNLTQQLLSRQRYEKAIENSATSLRTFEPAPVSDFFNINTDKSEPPESNEISGQLKYLLDDDDVEIRIVPGTFDLTKYSFVDDSHKLSAAKDFFKRFVSKAKGDYDLIVLDMNPSSSFLTFAGLSVASDIVSPVRPDKFSMLGLRLIRQLLEHPSLDSPPSLHIVMNGVDRQGGVTDTEKEIRSAEYFSDCILANRVYYSGLLAARADFTGFATDRKVAHRHQIGKELRGVADELAGRIGL